MTSIAGVDRLFEAHLTVADLDASIAFYRDRLGLELAHVQVQRKEPDVFTAAERRSVPGAHH